jgi:DNA polymerase
MELELDSRQRAMLLEMGVRVWQPVAAPPTAPPPEPVAIMRPAPMQPLQAPAPGAPVLTLPEDWATLASTGATCQACGLCAGRKHCTLSDPGQAIQADWMVVGDPPDEHEDRLGQPFAEQVGVLLDNMLKAVGARRTGQGRGGAYLSNVVKCRPPAGRVPQAAELHACARFLQREIQLVQPKVILAMGRFATQWLLQDHPEQVALPLDKQRGTVYRYQGIAVVVSYHPKVLLRASANKSKAWADLCLAMDVLEGVLPQGTATTPPYNGDHDVS